MIGDMKYQDYTNEAICLAMGIGPVVPPMKEALRVILRPSFHPEACITLEPERVTAVALESMLWRAASACRMPEFAETASLAEGVLERMTARHEEILGRRPKDIGNRVYLDGMPLSVIQVSAGKVLEIDGHGCEKELSGLIRQVLELAYSAMSMPELKNALADCGRYVDLKLPKVEVVKRTVQRILVLGEERVSKDLIEAVVREEKRRKK